MLPVVALSVAAGATLALTLRPSARDLAAPVVERTSIQQIAFTPSDTLQPAEPRAAGSTTRAIARVVATAGSNSKRGSGIVIRSGGSVVTALDLVSDATELTVIFESDDRRPATLVGTDPQSGLAVLRVGGAPLPPAVLGSAHDLADDAHIHLMIGTGMTPLMAPTSLDADPQTITAAGVDRPGMLRTTPPRAQGVLGAAALDSRGTVVGVVTRVQADRAFITPTELLRRVELDLNEWGTVRRASLGIDIAERANGGVTVQAVDPAGPSAETLAVGDVITAIAGRPVSSIDDVAVRLTELQPGVVAAISIERAGIATTTQTTLG